MLVYQTKVGKKFTKGNRSLQKPNKTAEYDFAHMTPAEFENSRNFQGNESRYNFQNIEARI